MNLFKKCGAILLLVGIAAGIPINSQAQKTGYHILRTMKIGSAGGWDYIRPDASLKKIYTSHGNQVNIFDSVSGDSIGYIPHTQGVHGIAIAESFGKGYISCGRSNS